MEVDVERLGDRPVLAAPYWSPSARGVTEDIPVPGTARPYAPPCGSISGSLIQRLQAPTIDPRDLQGRSGFQMGGGGASIEPPTQLGWGVRETGSIDRTINRLL